MPSNQPMGRNKTEAHLVKDNFNKKEWQELWRRINTRTYYNVSFETSKTHQECH